MKTLKYLVAGLFVLCLAAPAAAQNRIVLAQSWDLDGLAVDDNAIVEAATLVDSKDDYTIAANPDVCRYVDITLTDADSSITSGTVTITGTDCLGQVKTATYTLDSNGSGVILADSTVRSAYFATVTKVENGVLTGEGGAADTLEVGYATYMPVLKTAYGNIRGSQDDAYQWIDLGSRRRLSQDLVTTNGVLTTALTEVTTDDDPFDFMGVNDMLFFNIDGVIHQRMIVTYTNDSNVVLNQAINIPAAGVGVEVSFFQESSDPRDIFAVNVGPWDSATFGWQQTADGINTGGTTRTLECTYNQGPDFSTGVWFTVSTELTATTTAVAPASDTIDLSLAPFSYCRTTFTIATGDDDDTGKEDIDLYVVLRKNYGR
jgi:hypothetical protein